MSDPMTNRAGNELQLRSLRQSLFGVIMVQLAAVLLLLHLLEGNYRPLAVAKYAVITSLFVASRFVRGGADRDHRVLSHAFLFLWFGDFFLILCGALPGVSTEALWVKIGGMVGFLTGYGFLLATYWRRVSLCRRDALMALPIVAIALPCTFILAPHVHGAMFAWSMFFTVGLGAMAWSALCTLHRGYYRKTVARRFAIAGLLIFLSDMGIGFSFFYPGMHRNLPWLGFEIWITYIPAWALLLLNLSEKHLRAESAGLAVVEANPQRRHDLGAQSCDAAQLQAAE